MLEHARQTFVSEAREILEDLESRFLDLENGGSREQIATIFRGLHTVKGSGAMFGYSTLSRFTHHFEDAYDRVRAGALEVDRRLIDLSLSARDLMVAFLELDGDCPDALALEIHPETTGLLDALASLTGGLSAATPPQPRADRARDELGHPDRRRRFRVQFRPDIAALRNGMRPERLIDELAQLGQITIGYDTADLPPLDALDPTSAHLGYVVLLDTVQTEQQVRDVFVFADDAELSIEEIGADLEPAGPASRPKEARPGTGAAPDRKDGEQAGPGPRAAPDARSDTIRVASQRLDDMMDALGELVIAQARLEQISGRISDPVLEAVVEEVQRLILGLRDTTMSIRMLPIETVFTRFRRVVRDLSTELGKDVRLETQGGDTELDKTMIDRLGEPLVHMIRNSIDHGVEGAEARLAAGKAAFGRLWLSARQEGGEVLITIEDDGRGLDVAAIRARAVEHGLIAADAAPSDAELQQLIFAPGFSTAKKVSAVSGRGVGMDAVRTTIDALRGSIDVATQTGAGTKITLRLPVTLAIIDGLLVRLGRQSYVIPLSAVEECVEFDAAEGARGSGRTMLRIREELVPFLELGTLFGHATDEEERRRVVIVRSEGGRIGLVVDDILGQNQTVIKPLGPHHRDVEGLAGATILGDGAVALIVDVASLVRAAGADPRGQGPGAQQRRAA